MKTAPKVVRRFEGLTLLVVVLNVANNCLRLDSTDQGWARYYGQDKGMWIRVLMILFSILLTLTFTHFITRKKSITAKRIYLFFIGLGILSIFTNHFEFTKSWPEKIDRWMILATQGYMSYLLFTSEFEKWLGEKKQTVVSRLRTFALGPFGIIFFLFVISTVFTDLMINSIPSSIYKEMALRKMKKTEEFVEAYKLEHGSYPASLEGMGYKSFLMDPSYSSFKLPRQFHQYQLQPDGQHYSLFDVGPDGVSGTADDIYPDPDANFAGYLKK